jgi:hypothetical protein
MKTVLETRVDGLVAREFNPTRNEKIASLRQAVQMVDI